jgi:hypothetical protein
MVLSVEKELLTAKDVEVAKNSGKEQMYFNEPCFVCDLCVVCG